MRRSEQRKAVGDGRGLSGFDLSIRKVRYFAGIATITLALFAVKPAEVYRIGPSNGQPLDQFGFSIALEGGVLVVGSRLDDEPAEGSGSAYVFRRDHPNARWVEEQKITSPTGASWDLFGRGVFAHRLDLLMGSPGDDSVLWNSGAIYVHRRGSSGAWELVQRVVASDPQSNPGFGLVLAGDGDMVATGAPRDSQPGYFAGSAYVFQHQAESGEWLQTAKLLPSEPAPTSQFGSSVAVSGAGIVVGSPHYKPPLSPTPTGRAYVFHQRPGGTWTEAQVLTPPDLAPGDYFGSKVAIDDRILAVATAKPSVYVYQRDAKGRWAQQAEIELQIDVWGLSLLGRHLAVGDPAASEGLGVVQIFQRRGAKTWKLIESLSPSEAGGSFGYNVLISDRELLVTELTGDSAASSESGAVLSYRRPRL